MPTDEQFIEWLRKIKEHCKSQFGCHRCKFATEEQKCQVTELAEELCDYPTRWNMEEIERIIGYDARFDLYRTFLPPRISQRQDFA